MSVGGHGTRRALHGQLAYTSSVYGPEKWAPLSATAKRSKRAANAALEESNGFYQGKGARAQLSSTHILYDIEEEEKLR